MPTETDDISTVNSNSRIAATLYCVATQFVSGNVSINTLHRGDDDDDNNNDNNRDVKELQKTAILGTAHTHTAESTDVKLQ